MDSRLNSLAVDCNTIIDHASDRQTFLSMPHLTLAIDKEEKLIETWIKGYMFDSKHLHFSEEKNDFSKLNIFGRIDTAREDSEIKYVRSKDKEAQILGLTPAHSSISINKIKSFQLKLTSAYTSTNVITGCDIMDDQNIVIAEYNDCYYNDYISLQDRDGIHLKNITGTGIGSLHSVCVIDKDTIVYCIPPGLRVLDQNTSNLVSKNTFTECYNITYDKPLHIYIYSNIKLSSGLIKTQDS